MRISPKGKLSGFFGNSVVPYDVVLKQTHERIFFRSRHMREALMLLKKESCPCQALSPELYMCDYACNSDVDFGCANTTGYITYPLCLSVHSLKIFGKTWIQSDLHYHL